MHETLSYEACQSDAWSTAECSKGATALMSSGAPTAQASYLPSTTALRSKFPGTAEHVGRVRQWLRVNMGACPVVEDVVLLASELVTNALKHSASGRGGSFAVAVHHRSADLRVEVTDQGGRWAPSNASDGLHGRGLVIVGTVARAWGITGDDSGRTAWFELDCP
jgi:anti-sigma regulatory factor (Ser/Thr protein kinase)